MKALVFSLALLATGARAQDAVEDPPRPQILTKAGVVTMKVSGLVLGVGLIARLAATQINAGARARSNKVIAAGAIGLPIGFALTRPIW